MLRPFVFRTREGFLVGLASSPEKGSPCARCVEQWLIDRHVWFERAALSDVKIRRDVLADLISDNLSHVFYEIAKDGHVTRLDCVVFPHPRCDCSKAEYQGPDSVLKHAAFAFSPIHQLKVVRYGTSQGNIWLAIANGEIHSRAISATGISRDKEEARLRAVENWMKKAALSQWKSAENREEVVGAGESREAAIQDALLQYAKNRTLKSYASSMKHPMMIVGANNWVRLRVPFFLLQQYDLYPLFYPNSMPAWVVGVVALSRLRTDIPPQFGFGSGISSLEAFDSALFKVLEACQVPAASLDSKQTLSSKLHMWWTHWVYRCPKIALRDVLHLETYENPLKTWMEFLKDGGPRVGITPFNPPHLPAGVRHLIRLDLEADKTRVASNINGIGTWASFQEALR